ncbi:DNA polymerase I [Granulicatella balaenopterae]|uniref:DNA polymerase I n=2 Tax=Granulicatella balaenopterae TaxID=137733 RepID=A0A1H9HSM3_9LACT|nr:DNA polymerase I [Granulicatella balaenopterae]
MAEKLLLIDGSSLAFRAFYSIMNLESFKNQNGLHTNALFSFHRMFESIMNKEQPSHVLVAYDAGKVTFRTAMYGDYKGGRKKTPSEFQEQMPYFPVLLDAFGVSHYKLANYEADDIIGTLARMGSEAGYEVVVVSGDKDLIQLAGENIRVEITTKGVSELATYTPEVIREKFNLTPEQIIDLKGLMGDSSDNYPGVTKVGEKTALKLLHQYGSVEELYEHIDEMKKSKLKENLINDKESAFLSKTLARIHQDAPIEITLEDTIYRGKDTQLLMDFYKEMNFQSFQTELLKQSDDIELPEEEEPVEFVWVDEVTPEMLEKATTLHVETITENYHLAEIVAVAFGNEEKVYLTSPEIATSSMWFQSWVEDEAVEKTVFDLKAITVLLARYGLRPKGVKYDISLESYLLDTNDSVKEIADIAVKHQMNFVNYDEVIYGKGAKLKVPEDKEVLGRHIAQKVKALQLLGPVILAELANFDQKDLYETMELPLADVLARMEIEGISVDKSRLEEMGLALDERLKELEQSIYEQAGEEFNVKSPKQLGVILFEKLNLPVIKKTKTGYSTAVDVLEKLAPQAPIVHDILEHRQLAKLKSTYVDGLTQFILADGKIHTRYIQTLTQTGRLSSADPNLQNIPIRTEEGRKIRYAFLPENKDSVILSSDYSQIELRVLAHISEDKHMIEAFKEGADIHSSTAMRIFGIDHAEDVTSQMRRDAKAVNFGIVYGISDYGLSQNLNISRKQAKEFIDRYLTEYSGVKQFMEDVVKQAKLDGYVETLFNRRRYLPDLHSSNFNVRSFAERTAMNSPIQGSAADILKMAMLEIDHELTTRQLKSKMLLQVHDELIFEVPQDELELMQSLVSEVMENAVSLHVPLKVDSNFGSSWYEAK